MGRNFHDDGLHAFLTGQVIALLRQEQINPARILAIREVRPEIDVDGDYKPIVTVVMESGRQFRLIIAEVTP